ncbi:MAG: GerMN domain-containing protein [Christensenellaceae bacterium]|nr:GerMN domain-containing protein [Christensenellaceae bacterium]
MKMKILCLIPAMILLFSGCLAKSEETASRELYFKTTVSHVTESGYLVPVSKNIALSDEMAKEALSSLIIGNAEESSLTEAGICPMIPKSSRFELAIAEKNAYLNLVLKEVLSEEKLSFSAKAAAETLLAFPGIEEVNFSVNGEKFYGALDFSESYRKETYTLPQLVYRAEKMVVPVASTLETSDSKAVFDALKNAPEGLASLLPVDAEFLSEFIEKDTLYIDLEGSFGSFSGEELEKICAAIAPCFMRENTRNIAFIWRGELLTGKTHSCLTPYINEMPLPALAKSASIDL